MSDDPPDLFAQFEVIRRVLDARRGAEAEGEGETEASAGSGPEATTGARVGGGAAVERDRAGGRKRMGLVAAAAALSVFVGGAGAATIFHAGSRGGQVRAAAASVPATAAATASALPTLQTSAMVSWVLSSVGSSEIVACDVSVCALLRARGMPASSLVTVQSAADVERADVVIVTPVLRSRFGSAAISALVSADPLAVYGSAGMRVEADAVALTGGPAYAAELAADRADRRAAGSALLRNTRVRFTQQGGAQARALLSAGLVDTRVCTLLATLASAHVLVLAGFTALAPGAGPDVPSSGVLISVVDGTPVAVGSASVEMLTAEVDAQQSPYRALAAEVTGYGGSSVLQIAFSQPEPLGLLGG